MHNQNACCDDHNDRLPATTAIINLTAMILPFVGLIAAMFLMWGWGFSWTALALFLGMYIATAFGITVGFHRLFTHRSFDAPAPVQAVLGILGCMAAEGSILSWVAMHRRHHQHSDHEGDPHSPKLHGDTVMGTLQGLYHAHMGWILKPNPTDLPRYVGDLKKSKLVTTISALFPFWILLGFALPTLIGGLVTMTWSGALLGFVWGGLVRIFFVHHVTWSVNSICHIWGTRPFKTTDDSRNNAVFGILAMGEGWHNNHHAFPTSAKHGLRWWEFDISYLLIRGMALVGLAWNIKVPAPERIEAKHRSLHR